MHLRTLYVLSDAFFDFIGSLEIYFDFLAIFDGLRRFLANPVRLSGSVGEIFEVCPAVRTNLGQSRATLSGWIWWFARSGFLTYNPGSYAQPPCYFFAYVIRPPGWASVHFHRVITILSESTVDWSLFDKPLIEEKHQERLNSTKSGGEIRLCFCLAVETT